MGHDCSPPTTSQGRDKTLTLQEHSVDHANEIQPRQGNLDNGGMQVPLALASKELEE